MLATLVLMGLGHLTLNIMSLGGLALGVGMLIDNSIVMLENIFRHRAGGVRDPEEAAHRGAGEVTSAVIFVNEANPLVALTLVPMLSAQLAKVQRASRLDRTRVIRGFHRAMTALNVGYRATLARSLRWRMLILGAALGALLGVLFLTRGLGSEFLPAVDDGNLRVYIRMPPGTPPEATDAVARRVEAAVWEMPHVRHVFTTAGGFLWGGSTSERSGRGSLDVQLSPAPARRDWPAGRWVATLEEKIDGLGIPGAGIFVRPPRIRGLRTNISGSDVAIALQGDDLGELQRLGEEVTRRLQGIPGLENLQPSTEDPSPQLVIDIDRRRAADLGLSAADVGQTVRTALDGALPTRFTEGNNEYDIRVRLPREQFRSAEDLGSIALFPGRDRPIYLRDIADVRLGLGPSTILRVNQNRQLRITGDVNDEIASVGAVSREIRSRLGALDLPDGYALIYGGEEEAIRENQRNLAIVTLLAIFLVLVVLAIQYESVTSPLVILVSVPLALIGVDRGEQRDPARAVRGDGAPGARVAAGGGGGRGGQHPTAADPDDDLDDRLRDAPAGARARRGVGAHAAARPRRRRRPHGLRGPHPPGRPQRVPGRERPRRQTAALGDRCARARGGAGGRGRAGPHGARLNPAPAVP